MGFSGPGVASGGQQQFETQNAPRPKSSASIDTVFTILENPGRMVSSKLPQKTSSFKVFQTTIASFLTGDGKWLKGTNLSTRFCAERKSPQEYRILKNQIEVFFFDVLCASPYSARISNFCHAVLFSYHEWPQAFTWKDGKHPAFCFVSMSNPEPSKTITHLPHSLATGLECDWRVLVRRCVTFCQYQALVAKRLAKLVAKPLNDSPFLLYFSGFNKHFNKRFNRPSGHVKGLRGIKDSPLRTSNQIS